MAMKSTEALYALMTGGAQGVRAKARETPPPACKKVPRSGTGQLAPAGDTGTAPTAAKKPAPPELFPRPDIPDDAVIISHESALLYWRLCRVEGIDLEAIARAQAVPGVIADALDAGLANRLPRYCGPAAFDEHEFRSGSKYAPVVRPALQRTGLPTPLDVVRHGEIGASTTSIMHSRAWSGGFPKGSLVHLDKNLYICAPSLALAQVACLMDADDALELAHEACGWYVLDPGLEESFWYQPEFNYVFYASWRVRERDIPKEVRDYLDYKKRLYSREYYEPEPKLYGPGRDRSPARVADGTVYSDEDYRHDYGCDYDPGYEDKKIEERGKTGFKLLPRCEYAEWPQFTPEQLKAMANMWREAQRKADVRIAGAKKLERFAANVVAGSSCLLESRLLILMSSERSRGGFGLPTPELAAYERVDDEGRNHLDFLLCWLGKGVGIALEPETWDSHQPDQSVLARRPVVTLGDVPHLHLLTIDTVFWFDCFQDEICKVAEELGWPCRSYRTEAFGCRPRLHGRLFPIERKSWWM